MSFHAREARYGGPAALATVLGWPGLRADQDALARAVYTPGRDADAVSSLTPPAECPQGHSR